MQQSFVFSSATSLSWRSSCVRETSTDSSKTSNRCNWRRRRRSNHSTSVTREGDPLSDIGRIRERWARFFRLLPNSKSDMLDPDIPKRLPQQPIASALAIEPTEEEIATAMKAIANAKAVRPDGLPAELLKLGLQQDRTILLEFHRLTTLIWCEGKVPQQWKDAVIPVLYLQEGRQDGVRKLPRHLARVTRG